MTETKPVWVDDQLFRSLSEFLHVKLGNCCGLSTNGEKFESIEHLWETNMNSRSSSTPEWYGKGKAYWDQCDASVEGVMGGYGKLSDIDIASGVSFLEQLRRVRPVGTQRAVDCGGGVGRTVKYLLLPNFDEVHLLEQSENLLLAAPEFIGSPGNERVTLISSGMQAFCPEAGAYDVIWIQWVIGHLTDADLVSFLERCKQGLATHGVICMKENCMAPDTREDGQVEHFLVDSEDSSVTRTYDYFRALFEFAGFHIVYKELQEDFPDELFDQPQSHDENEKPMSMDFHSLLAAKPGHLKNCAKTQTLPTVYGSK